MNCVIRELTIDDYDEVLALWQATEGIGLSESDSRDSIDQFLKRNPGLSFLALDEGVLVGAVVCGHDGRRGYIHHLAVRASHRRAGLGRALVDHCLRTLKYSQIDKCHLFVFANNQSAIRFWEQIGWTSRIDLTVMSHYTT